MDIEADVQTSKYQTRNIHVTIGYTPDYLVCNCAHCVGETIFVAAFFLDSYSRCTSRLLVVL